MTWDWTQVSWTIGVKSECINKVQNHFKHYLEHIYMTHKLATIVEGDPKAPFSIATTPRCRGGRYSIPRIWRITGTITSSLSEPWSNSNESVTPHSPRAPELEHPHRMSEYHIVAINIMNLASDGVKFVNIFPLAPFKSRGNYCKYVKLQKTLIHLCQR